MHIGQFHTAGLQVGHVYVQRLKARTVKGVGHFHMRIDALLAQNGHARAGGVDSGRGIRHGIGREGEMHMHAGILGCALAGMFAVGTGRVVALLADFPAHAVPHLVQLLQVGGKHLLRIAPDAELPFAHVQRCSV